MTYDMIIPGGAELVDLSAVLEGTPHTTRFDLGPSGDWSATLTLRGSLPEIAAVLRKIAGELDK